MVGIDVCLRTLVGLVVHRLNSDCCPENKKRSLSSCFSDTVCFRWSGRTLFQELQRLFPGSYQTAQLSTLQMGLRKIRAWSLELEKEPGSQEAIQAEVAPPSAIQADRQQRERTTDPVYARRMPTHVQSHEERDHSIEKGVSQEPMSSIATEESGTWSKEGSQQAQESQLHCFTMTIASALERYQQAQKDAGRSQKTLEWHRIALGLLQQYLVEERQLRFLGQLTENELRGWVRFLRLSSSASGTVRKASTISTYGRSVRAFCHWAVSKGYLPQTPLVQGILPKTESKRIQVLEPGCFDRLLVACQPEGAQGVS